MKRTQDANLGGMIFHVEEDAYARLDAYLESVKAHFRSYPDSADIVADIESRIAEQCAQANPASRIVTLADVERVIDAMGTVDQFGDAAERAPEQASAADPSSVSEQSAASKQASATESTATASVTSHAATRRLFRDPNEGLIAGVAAGLAAYFGVSLLVVRLLFLGSLFIVGPLGVILYLVLWVLVPVAKTTTDKLMMHGDPVTLASVEQRVREGIAAIPPGTRSGAAHVASIIGSAIRILVIGLAWVVGIAIAVAMAAAAVGLTVGLEMALLSPPAFLGDVLSAVLPVRGLAYYVFVVSTYFVALIPLLAIGLLAVAVLRRRTIVSSRWVAALLGIWLISLLVLAGLWASYHMPIAPIPAMAQNNETDFRWSRPLAAGQVLEVKGVNGGINVTAATGRAALVTGAKRWRRGDPAAVEIKVVEHARGLTICAVRVDREGVCEPGGSGRHGGKGWGGWGNHNNDVSVEFTVRVPAGVAFEARTVNGGVRATGLRSDVVASTVNGGVEISTTGTALGSTVNGHLHVVMGTASWTGAHRYSTVNGGVVLELPAAADVDLEATTVNGSIKSDFPITVQGRIGPRRLSGTIGKGGRTLTVSTVNGSVQIRKGS